MKLFCSMSNINPNFSVAVMDGTCALCAFGARMVNRLDKSGTIRIAPIQGQVGSQLMVDHGLDPLNPDSWLLIEARGAVHRDLEALIRLGQMTGGMGRLFILLRLFPKPVRNCMYAHVAQNRYTLFGRADMCSIPNEKLRARLLS